MKRTAFKIAASTIIVSMTMVACTAQSVAMRRAGSSAQTEARSHEQAVQFHEQARQALQQGQVPQALEAIENAVALSPRDAGYRLLLADVYLKSGRFEAARSTYADVVEIDPNNARATLSLALTQIALGRPQAALAQLDSLEGRASVADLGLAYALAGMPQRSIEMLEPAARGFDATPRLRQNLALSYALAGDWQRARAVAAQDLSPADLGPRLQQWAAMSSPGSRTNQVASVLGVNPVQDPGQPVRLALAPAVPVVADMPQEAFAAAEPAPESDSDWGVEDAAPVQYAEEAPSYYLPVPDAPAAQDVEQVRYAAAVQTLTQPEPAVVRTASAPLPAPVFRRQAPVAVDADVRRGDSRFVVQLGAFSNEGNAERAWQQAERRFGLDEHVPLTTTIELGGRTLHRVSVAGFASQRDAARLCGSIRAQGGACFVRANAGDASVRWAARYSEGRNREA